MVSNEVLKRGHISDVWDRFLETGLDGTTPVQEALKVFVTLLVLSNDLVHVCDVVLTQLDVLAERVVAVAEVADLSHHLRV